VKHSLARLLIVAVAATFATSAVAATPVETAQSQLAANDLGGALKTLDAYLKTAPQDAEARFTRGLVLVKLNKTDDALKAFSDLTRDYPQLPEPYNNLAVLYAQQGDYEKARDALEAALATHPAYATAHENLGDIYAALAGAAYNRALMLDKENGAVKSKIDLVNKLDTGLAGGSRSAPAPAAKPAVSVAASAPIPVQAPVAAPVPLPPPAAAVDSSDAVAAAAIASVNAWAKAWGSKDIAGYLNAYGPEFTPEGGLSRAAWEQQRRERINRAGRISVRVANPSVTKLSEGRVRVKFTQDYRADNFSDQVSKVLELKDSGGGFKISREAIR
jgi:tetratricopeptide (TPR) repeat protein